MPKIPAKDVFTSRLFAIETWIALPPSSHVTTTDPTGSEAPVLLFTVLSRSASVVAICVALIDVRFAGVHAALG